LARRLTIQLFGYPQLQIDGTPLKVERRKTLALLAYLAVEAYPSRREIPGQTTSAQPGHGRETLSTLLWPDYSQEQAGSYLRHALWDFSKQAGEEWIIRQGQAIYLNPQAEIWVDVQAFETLLVEWKGGEKGTVTALERLNEAAAFYREDFLAGFTLRDSPAFDDWQALQAETLRLHLSEALEALALLYGERGEYERAIPPLRRWLGLDPLNEAAHRLMMRLYEESGQRTAALRQYDTLRRLLREELNLEPEPETVALLERIHSGRLTPDRPHPIVPGPAEQPTPGERVAPSLPTGTVTFLFTDIEGSTQLWENHPQAMPHAFSRHEEILRGTLAAHGGYIYKMVGDSFQVAFSTAQQALAAALAAQRALISEPWSEIGALKVRMALHTGVTEERGDDYVGPELNRVARLLNAGHGSQVLLSRSTFDMMQKDLPEGVSLLDLGEWHLRGLIQPEHIYQLAAPDLPLEYPPLRSAEAFVGNLPQQTTSFIGREAELARIQQLLNDPDCRLVSLVGIGGSGKTRLAIQAAGQSQGFSHGAYFVGLAEVSSLDGLIRAIAEALLMAFHILPGASLPLPEAKDQLVGYLSRKKALLVLDNFEQLAGQASFLTDLLEAAPRLKLLVTARERLNLPGEWVMEIDGLPYPGLPEQETIPEYAAVQLFLKGAERVGHFTATPADWPAIARICQLVEGIPLGVEMAAAWTRLLSCQEIAAEIERDLDFLTATWRGMPERHRTLRAVFDSSWRLLPENERKVFVRLSVFRGTFNRTAALQVAGATLSLLAALTDKSFVRRISSGDYQIHPVLKQYAGEMLAADPALARQARSLHADYYAGWLCQMYEKLKGSQLLETLSALRSQAQNLHAAWRWLIEQRDFPRLQQVLPALILFHELSEQGIDTQEVIQLLVEMADALRQVCTPPAALDSSAASLSPYAGTLALTLAAIKHFTLRYDISQYEKMIPYQQESLQYLPALPDSQEKAMALLLNSIFPGVLTAEPSFELIEQCIQLFQRLGDTWGTALAQLVRGDTANFGHLDAGLARVSYLASLEKFSALDNEWGKGLCLTGLLFVEYKAENLEEAYRLGRQALEIYDRLGLRDRTLPIHFILGEIAEGWGRKAEAQAYYAANQAYYASRGDPLAEKYDREFLASLRRNRTKPPPASDNDSSCTAP